MPRQLHKVVVKGVPGAGATCWRELGFVGGWVGWVGGWAGGWGGGMGGQAGVRLDGWALGWMTLRAVADHSASTPQAPMAHPPPAPSQSLAPATPPPCSPPAPPHSLCPQPPPPAPVLHLPHLAACASSHHPPHLSSTCPVSKVTRWKVMESQMGSSPSASIS